MALTKKTTQDIAIGISLYNITLTSHALFRHTTSLQYMKQEAVLGCPIGSDTCPSFPGLDPIHNFMGYTDDSCMDEFTPLQFERMDAMWKEFRDNSTPNPTSPPTTVSTTKKPTMKVSYPTTSSLKLDAAPANIVSPLPFVKD